jgi:hypothetical protein
MDRFLAIGLRHIKRESGHVLFGPLVELRSALARLTKLNLVHHNQLVPECGAGHPFSVPGEG